ncbi:cellulase family glycosylhydrolase [Jonesia denitrificans]|uniref:cellulase n=1 Tax=Jonesia denitrificans (strain ATCC 14870 / DSM 20603 / BCRC 15368 / CIP 55.134 / JCM 11481 / NBRC 15587 / NCTC 10816 / Prevot 55134) TaxID=471856 RepID=C7R1N0_JONDD|nr:cellulase family glycosylhydrolase [Jonesia denitrificans]ACV09865.1 glycoside hydrolase family 5 [Jonesia denitrificans DSM 20603]ASE08942.1 beta-mannosidase [Jonesia denitrificans]QXB43487.1 cellulase family glycosylhydrolase [Jonesia denitrificans]SQH22540.1 Mannan endo-1,4-beta-mannosidase precursor [Jonesia denitrificans]
MRSARAIAAALALASTAAFTAPVSAASAATPDGIHVKDGRIYEADGTELILRGVNHAHAWYNNETGAYADIAHAGANSVRTVLSNGVTWSRTSSADVAQLISLSEDAQLINMLEVHDTTGYGDSSLDSPRSTLAQAADYWISLKDVLVGTEDHVIINLGNEPFGNNDTTNARYVNDTTTAITRLRNAGLTHTIVVDAPGWGQDWQHIMRDNAATILNADPLKNVVFSVHMYEVYSSPQTVKDYINSYRSRELPLIIGEFASTHFGKPVAWETILNESTNKGIGYYGWSWSGNGPGLEALDIVNNFNGSSLTTWGKQLFTSPHGIAKTATTASYFTGSTGGNNGEYPTCASASSDPDGDGWGWENNQSCIVPTPTTYPTCASASSDPDGDGWGWENNQSCIVKP